MTKDKELLDLALEALRSAAAELYRASSYCNTYEVLEKTNDAITAIQQARAAPVQEPVGTYGEIFESMRSLLRSGRQADQQIYMAMQHKPLYTSPPAQPTPVQPVAWIEILRNNRTATDEVIGAFLRGHAEHLTGETFVLTTPPAQPAPVQEPVWIRPDELQKAQKAPFLCRVGPNKRDDFVPLYTTPPAAQRQWVGLTDEERDDVLDIYITAEGRARAIEAKLKELNT